MDKAGAQEAVAQLGKRSIEPAPTTEKSLIPFEALTLVLTLKHLPQADQTKRLEQAVALARGRLVDVSQRATILGVVASRLPREQRQELLNEVVELAKTQPEDNAVLFAFLAALFPGAEGRELMQHAWAAKQPRSPDAAPETQHRIEDGLIRLFAALALSASLPEVQAEMASVLAELFQYPKDESRMVTLTAALILSPKLPADLAEALIREIFEAVRAEKDEEARAMLLVVLASCLPTELLRGCVKELLAAAQRAPRPGVLAALALVQGLASELWEVNPHMSGNRIPGSPLARLGGDSAVSETDEAIRDVCSWWT